MRSFTDKSKHGFNNVAWDKSDYSLLAATTGTGLSFYDGHEGVKFDTHQSTSDSFKDKFITDIVWSKGEQSLILSHSKIGSTQTIDEILLKSTGSSIEKFKLRMAYDSGSSYCKLEDTHSLVGAEHPVLKM